MPDSRKIIRNVYILPCDGSSSGGIGTVTIRNERITTVTYGRSRTDFPAPDVEIIDGNGKILLPGFIDLHVHGESLLLDLLTAGEPQSRWSRLPEFTTAESFWHNRATTDDWRRLYTAVFYMALRSGVTFLGEFGIPGGDAACSGALEAFQRTQLPGMLTLHNADQIEKTQLVRNASLRFSLALPPAEELTTYNLQASLRLSKESGLPLLVHMGDPERDEETLVKNFGRGSLRVLDEFGVLGSGAILVHLARTDEQAIQLMAGSRAVPVVSPGGATRRGHQRPPMSEYRSAGLSVALCTDWGPFSHWAVLRSMMEQATTAKNQVPSAISCLQEMTVTPAAVLGLAQEVGSISPGMRANLQLIKCRNLELHGGLDVLSPATVAQAMVQRVTNSDVSDVMVNGEFSIREGTILPYSEEDLVNDLRELLRVPRTPRIIQSDISEQTQTEMIEREPGAAPAITDEEGFRIVRRRDENEEGTSSGNILPLDPDRERKKELPKTVRRVFGDDDR